jgi:hypothetical protein
MARKAGTVICANCPHSIDALHARGLRELRTLRQGARYIVVAQTDGDVIREETATVAEAIERIDTRLRAVRSEAMTVPEFGSNEEGGL